MATEQLSLIDLELCRSLFDKANELSRIRGAESGDRHLKDGYFALMVGKSAGIGNADELSSHKSTGTDTASSGTQIQRGQTPYVRRTGTGGLRACDVREVGDERGQVLDNEWGRQRVVTGTWH